MNVEATLAELVPARPLDVEWDRLLEELGRGDVLFAGTWFVAVRSSR